MSDFRCRSVVDGAQPFGQLCAITGHPGVSLYEQANRDPSNPCPSEICQILRYLLPILTHQPACRICQLFPISLSVSGSCTQGLDYLHRIFWLRGNISMLY